MIAVCMIGDMHNCSMHDCSLHYGSVYNGQLCTHKGMLVVQYVGWSFVHVSFMYIMALCAQCELKYVRIDVTLLPCSPSLVRTHSALFDPLLLSSFHSSSDSNSSISPVPPSSSSLS